MGTAGVAGVSVHSGFGVAALEGGRAGFGEAVAKADVEAAAFVDFDDDSVAKGGAAGDGGDDGAKGVTAVSVAAGVGLDVRGFSEHNGDRGRYVEVSDAAVGDGS